MAVNRFNLIHEIRGAILQSRIRDQHFEYVQDPAYAVEGQYPGTVCPVRLHDSVETALMALERLKEEPHSRLQKGLDTYINISLNRMIYGSLLIHGRDVPKITVQLISNDVWRCGSVDQSVVSRYEVFRLLENSLRLQELPYTIEAVQAVWAEIAQHCLAAHYLIEHLCLRNEPLTEHMIQNAHRILVRGISGPNNLSSEQYGGVYRWNSEPEDAGHLNRGECGRLNYQNVPGTMRKLIDYYNDDMAEAESIGELDPIRISAKTTYLFANIRPFVDGNGRLCRLLLNALLLKHVGLFIPLGFDPFKANEYRAIMGLAEIDRRVWETMLVDDEKARVSHYEPMASYVLRFAAYNAVKLTRHTCP